MTSAPTRRRDRPIAQRLGELEAEGRIVGRRTIERATAGDDEALDEIWLVHHHQLVRLLRACRTPEPEEVAGRIWARVGRSIGKFEGDGLALQRWLFRLADRMGTARRRDDEPRDGDHDGDPGGDHDRDPDRDHGGDADVDQDRDGGAPGAGVGPGSADDEPLTDRRSVALDDALDTIATLEPAAAEVVVLWLVHELSVAEICSITGLAPDRVKDLVRSGVAQLRTRAAPRP